MSYLLWIGIVIGSFIIVYFVLALFEIMSEYHPKEF